MASRSTSLSFHSSRPLACLLLGHNGYQRGFSATTRSRGPLLDFAVAAPIQLIDAIHGTGLPYYATIPLTAILVRTTIVYYISTKPARRQARLMNDILPLLEADRYVRQHGAAAARTRRNIWNDEGFEQIDAKLRASLGFWFNVWQGRRKYRKMFFRGRPPVPFLNFGILIAFTESIRLKCGRSGGLLSYLISPAENAISGASPPPADTAETLAAKLQAARDGMIARTEGGEAVDLSNTPISIPLAVSDPAPQIDTLSPYFDPAMQMEGFKFCTDLTQLDPTHLLPSMATCVILMTALYRPFMDRKPATKPKLRVSGNSVSPRDGSRLAELAKSQTWVPNFTNLERIGFLMAAIFGYVIHAFPAGIVLYIGPSILAGWLQNRYLDIKDPIRPGIRKCGRPLRTRSSQLGH